MMRAFYFLEVPNKTFKQQKNKMNDKSIKFIDLIKTI